MRRNAENYEEGMVVEEEEGRGGTVVFRLSFVVGSLSLLLKFSRRISLSCLDLSHRWWFSGVEDDDDEGIEKKRREDG